MRQPNTTEKLANSESFVIITITPPFEHILDMYDYNNSLPSNVKMIHYKDMDQSTKLYCITKDLINTELIEQKAISINRTATIDVV